MLALWFAAPAAAQKAEGLTPTPPMGWNSWNHYGCDIDEGLIRRTADALVASGLQLVQIRTTATTDLPAGTGQVSLHFAGAAQTIDLGPVYVLKGPVAP